MSQGRSTSTLKARKTEVSNPAASIDESDLIAVLQHSLQGLTLPQATRNKDGGKIDVRLETDTLLEITLNTNQMETNFVAIEAEQEVLDKLSDELVWNINNNQEKFDDACEKSKSLRKDAKQLDVEVKTLASFYLELVNMKEIYKGKIATKIGQLERQNEELELKHLQEQEEIALKKELLDSLTAECEALEEKQLVEIEVFDIDQMNQKIKDASLRIKQLDAEKLAIEQKKEKAFQELVQKKQEMDDVKQTQQALDARLKEKMFNNCVLKQRVNDEMKIVEQICVSKMSHKSQQIDDQNSGVAEQIQKIFTKAEKLRNDTAELKSQRQQVTERNAHLEKVLAENMKSLEVMKEVPPTSILDSGKYADEKKQLEEDCAAAISEQEKIKSQMIEDKKAFEKKLALAERKLVFHDGSEAGTDDEDRDETMSSFSSSFFGATGLMTKSPSSSPSGDKALPNPKRKKR